jgi:AcrR family transcriptional regulator
MARSRKTSASPRKLPEQDRSRATVDVIVDAAARVLVKGGYAAFTTNRVAEKAGVSIGSLYQYFPNKEALLSELMRRHVDEIGAGVEEMASRPASAPLSEIIRGAIEHNVRAHLHDPELHRVLSEEVPRLGTLDWEAPFVERVTRHVRLAFEARRAEIVVADLDLATYIVAKAVDSLIHDAVVDRQEDLKSGALAEEVTRMMVGYLTGKPLAAARKTKAAAE